MVNPGNAFGEILLGLIEEEYEDYNDALEAVADFADTTPEHIEAIIDGSIIVDDVDLLGGIAAAFDATEDEEILSGFLAIAQEVEEADRELGEEIAAAMADSASNEREPALAGSYKSGAPTAEFTARVNDLERTVASFKASAEVSGILQTLRRKADFGVNQGWLPPVVADLLLGSADLSDNTRVAAFGQSAVKNDIDIATQLFAIDFALDIFERCGNQVEFRAYAESDIDDSPVTVMVEEAARRNVKAFMGVN